MTDSFDNLEWEYTAKGQRTAPGPHYRSAGRYTLTRDWGIPDVLYRQGQTVYLDQEEATRLGRAGAIEREEEC